MTMMKQSENRARASSVLLHLLLIALLFISFSAPSQAYKNYTVGDSLGWFDNLEKPDINYQKWADAFSFSLGDFLIFNTDNNHSVIQTHNATVYALCDSDNAALNDTYEWSSADPSSTTPRPVTVAVPLVTEGPVYFFSGDYDGEQCQNGQHFKINVTHGQGLPDSLNDAAPSPANPDAGNDDSAPDTVVSSDFDNPKDDGTEDGDGESKKKKDSSAGGSGCPNLVRVLVGFGMVYLSGLIS